MPERWERELSKLRGIEVDQTIVRERVERGPSDDRPPPRRSALIAGIVAGAVAIGGVAFLGQASDPQEDVAPHASGTSSPTPSSAPSESVDGTRGIVVSVFGLGERSDEMPTASFSYGGEEKTACTQDYRWTLVDGTKLSGVADATGPDSIPECTGPATEVPPGTSIAIQTSSATRVVTTRTTTQFFEGAVGLVVSATWPEGEATFVIPLTVASDAPSLELVVLDCGLEEQVDFPAPNGPRILPGGSAYIVGNLPGFERGDVVEQMTRDQGGDSEWSGVWQVVRDGAVVASVDFPDLSGTACSGSGIGGT
jgi:hypothetical protein